MSLYPRYYELKICPVCRELVEEDYEMGARHWHKGYHGDIEPVTIKIPVPEQVETAIRSELVQSALKEKIAKQERWDAQLEWWDALPKEEKERREAERRAKLSPMARAIEDCLKPRPSLLDQIGRFTIPIDVEVKPGTTQPTTKEGD